MQTRLLYSLGITMCLLLVACTSAPPAPPGAQYFADARKNLTTSDFDAALKNLDRSIKAAGDQPIGQEASVLRAVLLTALAESAKQMAEAYAAGLKEPAGRARFGNFNKMRGDYYGGARVRLIGALQAVLDQRAKLGGEPLPLEVDFPVFTGAEDPAVTKIKKGYAVEDAERYRAEMMADRNALARLLTTLAGAGEDPHKGQEIFSKGKVDIDPRVYLIELSSNSLRLSEIFGSRALDERDHLRAVYQVASDNINLALKLLTAKPDKDLETRAKKVREQCDRALKILGS